MTKLRNKINTWIFDLDNTLYSADSGIFQQVHILMGNFVSQHLNIELKEAKLLHDIDKLEMAFQAKFYQDKGMPREKLQTFFYTALKEIKNKNLHKILLNFME